MDLLSAENERLKRRVEQLEAAQVGIYIFISPNSKLHLTWFFYMLLRFFQDELKAVIAGSALGNMKRNRISEKACKNNNTSRSWSVATAITKNATT